MLACYVLVLVFFFFNDTATTEIYTLSLHDALPISAGVRCGWCCLRPRRSSRRRRSEEHTSELQSQSNLVCRLLLEKKKKNIQKPSDYIQRNQIHHAISRVPAQ